MSTMFASSARSSSASQLHEEEWELVLSAQRTAREHLLTVCRHNSAVHQRLSEALESLNSLRRATHSPRSPPFHSSSPSPSPSFSPSPLSSPSLPAAVTSSSSYDDLLNRSNTLQLNVIEFDQVNESREAGHTPKHALSLVMNHTLHTEHALLQLHSSMLSASMEVERELMGLRRRLQRMHHLVVNQRLPIPEFQARFLSRSPTPPPTSAITNAHAAADNRLHDHDGVPIGGSGGEDEGGSNKVARSSRSASVFICAPTSDTSATTATSTTLTVPISTCEMHDTRANKRERELMVVGSAPTSPTCFIPADSSSSSSSSPTISSRVVWSGSAVSPLGSPALPAMIMALPAASSSSSSKSSSSSGVSQVPMPLLNIDVADGASCSGGVATSTQSTKSSGVLTPGSAMRHLKSFFSRSN